MSNAISMILAIKTVETVLKVDAKKRIPEKFRGKITFFSDWDLWVYEAIMDDRTCVICERHKLNRMMIIGSKIRLIFPYLEIDPNDPNIIYVHAHEPRDPNCRCLLLRSPKIVIPKTNS